jgi:hypothetical protein
MYHVREYVTSYMTLKNFKHEKNYIPSTMQNNSNYQALWDT